MPKNTKPGAAISRHPPPRLNPARGGDDPIVTLAIVGLAGWLFYQMAVKPRLTGATAATAGWLAAPIGGTAPRRSSAPVVAPAGASSAFIAGRQYVAPLPGGGYEVVIGGQRVYVTDSLASAEAEFNRRTGGSGAGPRWGGANADIDRPG